jgi:hypothetical protein
MKKKITKQRMALLMKTSRAQVDRLLDPDNGSATIESLQRAAKIVGRELRLQLVRRRLSSPQRLRGRCNRADFDFGRPGFSLYQRVFLFSCFS